MANKITMSAEEIIDTLKKECDNPTIEGQLLRTKLIRQLYKQIGDPHKEDFPHECETAGDYWKKFPGYTTDIRYATQRYMEIENNIPTKWHIQRASMAKVNIVDIYVRAGWSCEVYAYNVACTKYVKHPRYKNLWVRFYSTRDLNRYEYVIEEEE